MSKGGFKIASKDPHQITTWWGQSPDSNVGVATGPVSRVLVLDVDGQAGELSLAQFEVPPTLTVRTPGKMEACVCNGGCSVCGGSGRVWAGAGRHLYFLWPEGSSVTIGQAVLGDHLDHRGQGGYVLAPPSVHPDGTGVYEWISPMPPAICPPEILARLEAGKAKRVATVLPGSSKPALAVASAGVDRRHFAMSAIDGIDAPARQSRSLLAHLQAIIDAAPGTKHEALRDASYAHACAAHEAGKPREDAEPSISQQILGALGQNLKSEVRDWQNAQTTVASAFDRAYARELSSPILQYYEQELNNDGLARRFARLYGPCPGGRGSTLYVERDGWRLWDGARWAGSEPPTELVSEMLIEIEQRVRGEGDEKLAGHVKTLKSAGNISAILKLSQRGMKAEFKSFDTDPFLLNCRNGTVDLRTATLRPGLPTDRITRVCAVPYEPYAACPGFMHALNQMQGGDTSAIEFLRLTLGSFAFGEPIDGFTILYGGGFDGKSTLLQFLHGTLGEYCRAFGAPAVLASKGATQHTSAIGGMAGARLAMIDELPADSQLDTGAIKSTFGRVPTRLQPGMGKDFQEIVIGSKLLIATNHLPRLDERDRGTLRRVCVVPFDGDLSAQGVRRDDTFPARLLAAEGPGILTWIVGGCRDWLARGRVMPTCARVIAATTDFVESDDIVGRFLETCPTGAGLSCGADDLYKAYLNYAADAEDWKMVKRTFENRMRERGHKPVKRIYHGVGCPALRGVQQAALRR